MKKNINNFTSTRLIMLSKRLTAQLGERDYNDDAAYELVTAFWEHYIKDLGISELDFQAYIYFIHISSSEVDNLVDAIEFMQSNGMFDGLGLAEMLYFLRETDLSKLFGELTELVQEKNRIVNLKTRCVEFFEEINKIVGLSILSDEKLVGDDGYNLDVRYEGIRADLRFECDRLGVDFHRISIEVAEVELQLQKDRRFKQGNAAYVGVITKARFLDWFFSDRDDIKNMGVRVLEDLKSTGNFKITIKELFDNCYEIPNYLMIGHEDSVENCTDPKQILLID